MTRSFQIQGLGWFVRRSEEPSRNVAFYRDGLGLYDLRSGSNSAMLWAGGTTVFEPNVGGASVSPSAKPDEQQVTPVFGTTDPHAMLEQLRVDDIEHRGGLYLLRDPCGLWLGIRKTTKPASPAPFGQLRPSLCGLVSVIVRSRDPVRQARQFERVTRLPAVRSADDAPSIEVGEGLSIQFAQGEVTPLPISDRVDATDALVLRVYDLEYIRSQIDAALHIVDVAMPGGTIAYYQDDQGLLFGFQERKAPDPAIPTSQLVEDIFARDLWWRRKSAGLCD